MKSIYLAFKISVLISTLLAVIVGLGYFYHDVPIENGPQINNSFTFHKRAIELVAHADQLSTGKTGGELE